MLQNVSKSRNELQRLECEDKKRLKRKLGKFEREEEEGNREKREEKGGVWGVGVGESKF